MLNKLSLLKEKKEFKKLMREDKSKSEAFCINKKEIALWKNIVETQKTEEVQNSNENGKLGVIKTFLIKKMFERTIINNLTNLNLLNGFEQLICEKLVKKFIKNKKTADDKSKTANASEKLNTSISKQTTKNCSHFENSANAALKTRSRLESANKSTKNPTKHKIKK